MVIFKMKRLPEFESKFFSAKKFAKEELKDTRKLLGKSKRK